MKRAIILIIFLLNVVVFPYNASAVEEYVGVAKHTNVVTYINDYAIPSYHLNGYTFITVESLEYYGFDIKWNEYNKTLRIIKNEKKEASPLPTLRSKPEDIGKEMFKMHKTEVRTFIGDYGYEIECLGGLPGYTLINVDNLGVFGSITWVAEEEKVKVYIKGAPMASYESYVPIDPYPYDYYDDCYHTQVHSWNCTANENGFFLFFSNYDDNKTVFGKCSGFFDIEIIDSDGKQRYKGKKYFDTEDFTAIPYIYGWMDEPLSVVVNVEKYEMRPATKKDGLGLVKVTYNCDCSEPFQFEMYAEDLP